MKQSKIERIESLTDLRNQKAKLHTKLLNREKNLVRHLSISGIKSGFNDSGKEIINRIGSENSFLSGFLPVAFKYKNEIIQSKIPKRLWRVVRKRPYIFVGIGGIMMGYAVYKATKKQSDLDENIDINNSK